MMSLDITTIEAQASALREGGYTDEADTIVQLYAQQQGLLLALDNLRTGMLAAKPAAKAMPMPDYYEDYLRAKLCAKKAEQRAERFKRMAQTLLDTDPEDRAVINISYDMLEQVTTLVQEATADTLRDMWHKSFDGSATQRQAYAKQAAADIVAVVINTMQTPSAKEDNARCESE